VFDIELKPHEVAVTLEELTQRILKALPKPQYSGSALYGGWMDGVLDSARHAESHAAAEQRVRQTINVDRQSGRLKVVANKDGAPVVRLFDLVVWLDLYQRVASQPGLPGCEPLVAESYRKLSLAKLAELESLAPSDQATDNSASKSNRPKLNKDQRKEIVKREADGENKQALAREYGVTRQAIDRLVKKSKEDDRPVNFIFSATKR
jgi:hypothetical protein